MEKKNCKSLLGSLSDYVDGTAQEELCRELEQHLAGCEDCRIVVDTLKKTVYLYHASTETDLPVAVRERLFKRLNLDEYLKPN
ncbi:MAG: zf-HC2 domain-containing protein [Anaerolineales bacterium]|nr:zf-HC2 domain-containing protein [Anaerolineales bacterium]